MYLEMERFMFNNHYPTSLVMDSLMLNNWKEIYITDDLYKYLKGGM